MSASRPGTTYGYWGMPGLEQQPIVKFSFADMTDVVTLDPDTASDVGVNSHVAMCSSQYGYNIPRTPPKASVSGNIKFPIRRFSFATDQIDYIPHNVPDIYPVLGITNCSSLDSPDASYILSSLSYKFTFATELMASMPANPGHGADGSPVVSDTAGYPFGTAGGNYGICKFDFTTEAAITFISVIPQAGMNYSHGPRFVFSGPDKGYYGLKGVVFTLDFSTEAVVTQVDFTDSFYFWGYYQDWVTDSTVADAEYGYSEQTNIYDYPTSSVPGKSRMVFSTGAVIIDNNGVKGLGTGAQALTTTYQV